MGLTSSWPIACHQRLAGLRRLTGVFYHMASDHDVPHVKHLYSYRSSKEFARDIDFYLRHYAPITIQDLIEHVKQGTPFPENSIVITIDDGFREGYEVMAPILKKKGVPATFYLCSGFENNRDLFYRNKASLLIEHIAQQPSAEAAKAVHSLLSGAGVKGDTVRDAIYSISYQNKELLDRCARRVGLDIQDYLSVHKPYMTTEEAKELMRDGFTIGAHSIDHPHYESISEGEQIRQTAESIQFIQDTFNPSYNTFAFPFEDVGVGTAFFDIMRNQLGVEVSFGTYGLLHDSVSNNFQRICIDNNPASAKSIFKHAYASQLFKVLIHKDRIKRG